MTTKKTTKGTKEAHKKAQKQNHDFRPVKTKIMTFAQSKPKS